jgi:hypothetical protein
MEKWEYLVGVKVHSKKEREQFLSRLGYEAIGQGTRYANWLKNRGREGWELVTIVDRPSDRTEFFMKRKLSAS